MERRQLIAFRTIARTLSFTKAADILGYAQSSITAQIKRLETALRVPLFERGPGRVRLTPFGERLLPYAERLIALTEEATVAMRADRSPAGRLTIGAEEAFTTYRLSGVVESFHHRHPEVKLSLRTFRTGSDYLESLSLGELDIVVLQRLHLPADDFHVTRLGREQMVLVAAADHPLRAEPEITPLELDGVRMVIAQPGCPYARLLQAEFTDVVPLEFGTVEAVKRAVVNGYGVSVLPQVAVRDLVAAGELAELSWSPENSIDTYAIWPRARDDLTILRAFVSLTERVISETNHSSVQPRRTRATVGSLQ